MSKRRTLRNYAGERQALQDGIFAALGARRAAIRTGARTNSTRVRAIDEEIKALKAQLKQHDFDAGWRAQQ